MTLIYRTDYVAPHYHLPTTELDFTLHPTRTQVKARLTFTDYETDKPLVLNGQYMQLQSIHLDGKKLTEDNYQLTDTTLTLHPKKKSFVLETEVLINPEANTRLMGLYTSNGMFCTQNEPEGFRHITYYPDHSDVPSRWITTIHADRKKYPVLLSNGNKIKDEGDTVVWEDPFNKPCYLFALVAGDLDELKDTFTTMSGKKVALRLYCEKGKGDRLTFAMQALKKAMKWDEERFGLEYDLDLFNIVAVSHFNAGAMENKSLNIFNDAALLASPDTATDATFEYIEHVIAHEYFHNYSGDRVTLRQWFELSLKEGFTVYRDQEFGYDVQSRSIGRIDDAMTLRTYQFPEDDGPLAHPVRPEAYQSIENFYTTTIYEKGAELIRMQEAIVGKKAFRKGCDLYFRRHDGQAVTIDDFVKAIEDASGTDLTAFKQWYSVAGRPRVHVETHWQEATQSLTITLTQTHPRSSVPFVIPLHYGLVAADGTDIKAGTFILRKSSETFVLTDLPEKPVLSLNRFFTAPVDIDITYTDDERLRLMTLDNDLFNRYDVGHQYALEKMSAKIKQGDTQPDFSVIEALGSYLVQPDLDKAFIARAIVLPGMGELVNHSTDIDLSVARTLRDNMRQAFANRYVEPLREIYDTCQPNGGYQLDAVEIAKRALKNVALGYLALTPHKDLVFQQYQTADNLTDRLSALGTLVVNDMPDKERALADFYERYEADDLVLNKWFAVQLQIPPYKALEVVKALINHPKFDYRNPNKVRAVIGAFAANLEAFHTPDGYAFYAGQCALIDKLNPNLAARLTTAFSKYKKMPENLRKTAENTLRPLLEIKGLSVATKETIERLL